MRSRPVPTEVAERVLDDLGVQEDVRTLSTCARVCRSWVPRATFNLWRKVTINGKDGLDSVRTALEHSSQLSRFIHAIRLEADRRGDFPHTALAVLFPFIGSRITSLEMYSEHGDGIHFPSAVFSRLQHYTALKTLTVNYQIFPTHHHVRRIFRALPALDTLELSEWHNLNRTFHDWNSVPDEQPRLKKFVIMTRFSEVLWNDTITTTSTWLTTPASRLTGFSNISCLSLELTAEGFNSSLKATEIQEQLGFKGGDLPKSLRSLRIILHSNFAYLFHFDIDKKHVVDTSLALSRLVQDHAKYPNGKGITFIIKNSTMNLRDHFRMWMQRLLSSLYKQKLLHIVFENDATITPGSYGPTVVIHQVHPL
ncbi:uncharacterized protein BXZ73DRAFT_99985 [Epithele typhae]|uniref:uncharacterized protein n=1 Tax=Epithele typhae TaxID=378194 RepID=UPI00200771F1|nr:uncharacterized protein BXZ73DRAFT_99985 [Epithele typhae]KAH9937764.1 hypothetical protein BXZ73DRAFT_99985 [Epithele typhae]